MVHKKAVLVGCSFVLGAAAAVLGGAVRSAHAEGEPKNAYFCFEATSVAELTARANAAGQRGWRMVSGGGHPAQSVWCFTRSWAE